jgi:hypothetical protein
MCHAIFRLIQCRFPASHRLTPSRLTSPAVSGVGLWLFGLLPLLLSPSSFAAQLTLAGDAASDPKLAGYFAAVTAYGTAGNESVYSNEVNYDLATGDNLSKIVVFQAGTPVQVQQQVVARSGRLPAQHPPADQWRGDRTTHRERRTGPGSPPSGSARGRDL